MLPSQAALLRMQPEEVVHQNKGVKGGRRKHRPNETGKGHRHVAKGSPQQKETGGGRGNGREMGPDATHSQSGSSKG